MSPICLSDRLDEVLELDGEWGVADRRRRLSEQMKVGGQDGRFRDRRYCDGLISDLLKRWKTPGFSAQIPQARREGAQDFQSLVPGHLDIPHHHERLDNNYNLRDDVKD